MCVPSVARSAHFCKLYYFALALLGCGSGSGQSTLLYEQRRYQQPAAPSVQGSCQVFCKSFNCSTVFEGRGEVLSRIQI